MEFQKTSKSDPRPQGISISLEAELKNTSEKCTLCEACQKECEFLRIYGKPKQIADAYDPSDKACQAMPFECSLCQLCASVCPEKINPATMFLEMRREKARRSQTGYPEHARMLAFERRGTSKRYSYYAIPAGCDTVFFPGCNLPDSRPDKTFKLYEHLKKGIPTLGFVLDCCMKISHDLGRSDHFKAMFQEMKNFLTGNGVRNVIVACPNCHRMFKEHGGELSVQTVYEILSENGLPHEEPLKGVVTIHDPCAVRFEEVVHSSIRRLVTNQGLTVEEMPHHGERTLCCGEGGFVGCISPDLSKRWGAARKEEANGRRMITYCAGCTNHLNGITPTSHVLDLLFEPTATLAGKARVSKAPMTYINRLRLKSGFRKAVDAKVTRERTFTAGEEKKKGGMKRMKKFFNGRVALLVVMGLFLTQLAIAKDDVLPTKENPLIADLQGKRVLIYTEVNEKSLHETNPHWGVVFKDGKFGGNAILKAYAHPLAFHDGLLNIGAKPGNNLTKDIIGKPVEGDTLEITATWPGLGKELNLKDIFYDKSGKGFDIKFGGNRKASEENNTGCITCLESCWIAISSNANYPTITGATRAVSPNSLFKGNAEVLPEETSL